MGGYPQGHDGCGRLAEATHHRDLDIRPNNTTEAENNTENRLGKQVSSSYTIPKLFGSIIKDEYLD